MAELNDMANTAFDPPSHIRYEPEQSDPKESPIDLQSYSYPNPSLRLHHQGDDFREENGVFSGIIPYGASSESMPNTVPSQTASQNTTDLNKGYQFAPQDFIASPLNHLPGPGYMQGHVGEMQYVPSDGSDAPNHLPRGGFLAPSHGHFFPHQPNVYGVRYVPGSTPNTDISSSSVPNASVSYNIENNPNNPHESAGVNFGAPPVSLPKTHPHTTASGLHGNTPKIKHPPNKQVAPRSDDLFRIGPPFLATRLHRPFFCKATHEQMLPIISSRIDRGFERGEAGNWIGYKRNYVTLVSTFVLQNWSFEMFLRNGYFVCDDTLPSKQVDITHFALGISVKCNDPDVGVGLVQHTPKRDKGPKYATPTYAAVPGGQLPDHRVVRLASNKKNSERVANTQKIFNLDRQSYYWENGLDAELDTSFLKEYPSDVITKVARFERIQFTKSLRVEPHGAPSKYFTLVIELLGVLRADTEYAPTVVLATSETVPLLVRGRSASMYPSEKTSGYRGTSRGTSHENNGE